MTEMSGTHADVFFSLWINADMTTIIHSFFYITYEQSTVLLGKCNKHVFGVVLCIFEEKALKVMPRPPIKVPTDSEIIFFCLFKIFIQSKDKQ